ncbi:MAG TPA: CHRD domain-containing protein [Pyrinomonadaceae bacterium]|jgi:hypothetical protein
MQRIFFLTLTIILSAMTFSTTAAAQGKFSVYLSGRQTVPANNSPGNGTCMVTINLTQTQGTVECRYRNLSSNVTGVHIHENGPVAVNGPIRFDLTFTGGTTGTISSRTFTTTPAQVADMRSNKWYVDIHTANFPNGEIRGQVKRANLVSDYDGDGRSDVYVYRAAPDFRFYILNSLENNITASIPVGMGLDDLPGIVNNMGDFDGDGRADLVAWNTDANDHIYWWILQSETNTVRTVIWGRFRNPAQGASDEFVPADYDGDGKMDVAVFRRATGVWYIIESSTGNPRYEFWGRQNDYPSVGDYDGDGTADLCVLRAESGLNGPVSWYIRNSSDGQMQKILWGNPATDAPQLFFPIDIDNDGKHDAYIRRGVNGQQVFLVRRSSDGQQYSLTWGLTSFFLQFGDYDGDGRTDFAQRQTTGGAIFWHIFQSSTQTNRTVQWGIQGDQSPSEQLDEMPVSSEGVPEF